MDDVVQHILEQVAFDGILGTSISKLWTYVEAYFVKKSQAQVLDMHYKEYLWNLFSQCEEFVIVVKSFTATGQPSLEPIPKGDNLAGLEAEHGKALFICTTEERQWITLTGHHVDHKEVPPMVFACLSAISSNREKGMSSIQLFKETGQDKRSVPNRCKGLVLKGLIRGFPILAKGTNTTQYVHCRFLEDNASYREQQASSSGGRTALDLHKVNLGICSLLASSTNHILKVHDVCRLMKMTTGDTDRWTQRRFFGQIRALAQKGYLRRIRVPGKQSGTLIKCVELLKEYQDSDEVSKSQGRQEPLPAEEVEDDCQDENELDDEPLQMKGDEDDLDLSNIAATRILEPIGGLQLCRGRLLELQIQQFVLQSGAIGVPGPVIRRALVGDHWSRPFDELMKKLAANAEAAVQPEHYSSLAIGPAYEEIVNRIHQYRYYSLHESWVRFGSTDKMCRPVSKVDGVLPVLDEVEFSSEFPPDSPVESKSKQKQLKTKTMAKTRVAVPKPENVKSQLNPDKKKAKSTKATAATQKVDSESSPKEADIRMSTKGLRIQRAQQEPIDNALISSDRITSSTRKRSGEIAPKPPIKKQKIQTTIKFTATARISGPSSECPSKSAVDPVVTTSSVPSELLRSSEHQVPRLVRGITGRRTASTNTNGGNSARDVARKSSTQLTGLHRKRLILQVIESQNGIVCLNVELRAAYDSLLESDTGIQQTSDRKTLKRALEELYHEQQLHWIIRAFPSHTGNSSVRRDIFFLRSIDPESDAVASFLEDLREKQAQPRNIYTPHVAMEVLPRPEMDILPTVAHRISNAAGLRPLNLAPEELSQLRIRLAQKASADTPSTPDTWYQGHKRLLSIKEIRQARKEDQESAERQEGLRDGTCSSARQMAKPHLRKYVPHRVRTQKVAGPTLGDASNGTSAFVGTDDTTRGGRSDEEVLRATNSDRSSRKKRISKRADRFEDAERLADLEEVPDAQPEVKRKRARFTEEEDDTLIRAVNLAMIFFSPSDLQFKVDWNVVTALYEQHSRNAVRLRYANARNRPRFRTLAKFLQSPTFGQLYNEAVTRGELSAIPRTAVQGDGSYFDLRPHINFTRRFDPEKRIAFSEVLPESIDEFHRLFSFGELEISRCYEPTWRDELQEDLKPAKQKKDVLCATAFCITDSETASIVGHQRDKLLAAIKALLLTSEELYDATTGFDYLGKHGAQMSVEELLNWMLELNMTVHVKGNENRIVPGRNYHLSEKFFIALRSTLAHHTLRSSAKFGKLLNQALGEKKTVLYPPLANNGASMCTLEMAVLGLIRIERGPTRWTKTGLINDYAVRQIEPETLDFDLILTKGPRDWQPALDVVMSCVPTEPCLWVDVKGNVMEALYGQVLCLVLNYLLSRGRLSFGELFRLCGFVLTFHELVTCLDDLTRKNAIRLHEGMYEATDNYFLMESPDSSAV